MRLGRLLNIAAIICITLAARAQSTPAPATGTSSGEPAQLAPKVESFLRYLFAWGPEYQVKIGPFKDAAIPGFYEVQIEVKYKDQSQSGVVYSTKDGNYMVRGEIYKTSDDPFAATRKELSTTDSPSKGPGDSKITLIEFSDFECPHCRQFHQYLPTLEQKYPQLRIVFKNFPIENLHPWAMTAAIAGRCVYLSSPAAFWNFEATVFDQQELISAENAYDKLSDAAVAAGHQRDAFASCVAAPASRVAIQADMALGQKLGVSSTPTIFINGREVTSADPAAVDQLIDYELHPKR